MLRPGIARSLMISAMLAALFLGAAATHAQQSQTTGEVRFSAYSDDERNAGIWVDGKYMGYAKEFNGEKNKKMLLPPGDHEISIRQDGYQDITKTITVAAGQLQNIEVSLVENPKAIYPGADRAELRLDIRPKNAAVYVDNLYVGHGSEFGGRFHSLLVSPAKHQLKVTMKGYRTYQTEINPVASEKTQLKIVLEPGADPQP
jgi:PEGA domain-containing protein